MIKIRPYKDGWQADISVRLPDGKPYRERRKAPTTSKTAAERWAKARERHLLVHGPLVKDTLQKVPTIKEFFPTFKKNLNGARPSYVAKHESVFRTHLLPALGDRPLDQINGKEAAALAQRLADKSGNTANNVMITLRQMFKTAQRLGWEVEIPPLPRRRASGKRVVFYDAEERAALISASESNIEQRIILLLGMAAGLRAGEIAALKWSDLDFANLQINISRSLWRGIEGPTKGGRVRHVHMTAELAKALRDGAAKPYVLGGDQPLTDSAINSRMRSLSKRAGVDKSGMHILRHTFCSCMAMAGVPPRVIQELAGHTKLSTTERYLHLSPGATHAAIKLLEGKL